MIGFLFGMLVKIVENFVHNLIRIGLLGCVAFSVCHYCGWLQRLIWWKAEQELSKICNDARVTIGSFRIQYAMLLQGRIVVHGHNVIIHTPQRDLWQWHSPLIARVGYAEIDCNAPITVLHLLLFQQEVPLELYSIQVSDMQIFVERKQNIFNFYLLDKAMILPDPKEFQRVATEESAAAAAKETTAASEVAATAAQATNEGTKTETESKQGNGNNDDAEIDTNNDSQVDDNNQDNRDVEDADDNPAQLNANTDGDGDENRKAAEDLVDEMLHAVKSLGKAARRGALQGAIQKQGHTLADKLRDMRRNNKEALQKSVRVMRQVGVVAAEQLAPRKLEQLVPQRLPNDKPPPKARIGRILLTDLRLFTRNSWIRTDDEAPTLPTTNITASDLPISGWNRPITIAKVIVRSSELCPPMSLLDDRDLPAIHQPLDRILDVVWKRIVTEMAKSNTGRLFQTAFSEALGYMKRPNTNGTKPAARIST